MTTWLWIIGIIAIVWPVVFVFMVSGHDNRAFTERLLALAETTGEKIMPVGARMSAVQEIIEEQDALIAALWAKVYGYHPHENDPLIHSWKEHPRDAYGVCPRWKIRTGEDRHDELSRVGNYPWREM